MNTYRKMDIIKNCMILPKDINYIIFSYLYPIPCITFLYSIDREPEKRKRENKIHRLTEHIQSNTLYACDLDIIEYEKHLLDGLDLYNYMNSYTHSYLKHHKHTNRFQSIVENLDRHINFHSIYALFLILFHEIPPSTGTYEQRKHIMIEKILSLTSNDINEHISLYYENREEYKKELETICSLFFVL